MDWANSTFEQVTIRAVEDVRPAAIAIRDIALKLDLRIAVCPDISSKEQMLDADGKITNDGTRNFLQGFAAAFGAWVEKLSA
jgi:hypothetical protein